MANEIRSLSRAFVLVLTPFVCFDGVTSPLWAQNGRGFFGGGPPRESLFSQLSVSVDGVLAATDGHGKSVRLWDSQTGQFRRKLEELPAGVSALEFSADGRTLAVSDRGNVIRLYDAQSGQLVQSLRGHTSAPMRLKFSPDSKTIVSGSDGLIAGKSEHDRAELFVWSCETGQILRRLPQSKGFANDIAFLPDGETLLVSFGPYEVDPAEPDGVQIWNLKSGERLGTLKFEPFRARSMAVSPDGKLMAYGSHGIVLLWDIPARKLLRALHAKGDDLVIKLAFSPDGRSIASAASRLNSGAYVVRAWEAANSHELWQRDFQRHVLALEFTRDGSTLIAADYESMLLYDFESAATRREWFPRGDVLQKSTKD